MKLFCDDVNLDGQLQRTVAKFDSGVANVGECLHDGLPPSRPGPSFDGQR